MPLAELVDEQHAVRLRDGAPVLAPGVGAGSGVAAAEVAAVDEEHWRAASRLVVPGFYTIDINRTRCWEGTVHRKYRICLESPHERDPFHRRDLRRPAAAGQAHRARV